MEANVEETRVKQCRVVGVNWFLKSCTSCGQYVMLGWLLFKQTNSQLPEIYRRGYEGNQKNTYTIQQVLVINVLRITLVTIQQNNH